MLTLSFLQSEAGYEIGLVLRILVFDTENLSQAANAACKWANKKLLKETYSRNSYTHYTYLVVLRICDLGLLKIPKP